MNSDKAAAVRDSINGCPGVASDDDTSEYPSDRTETFRGRTEITYTGEFLRSDRLAFSPAYIEQSGVMGDGNGAERPVFVVILEPIWSKADHVFSVPSAMLYEIAKHDCSVRFYPEDHRLGPALWVVDHFQEDLTNTDGDRCPDCGSTYFKIRDGEPECARCGATEKSVKQTTLAEAGGGG